MLELFVDPSRRRDLSAQLFDQMRTAIATGRVQPGDRLPPTRQVAAQLGVARQTVTAVYSRLTSEGFLEGRAGGGTYVLPGVDTETRPRARGQVISVLRPRRVLERVPPERPLGTSGGDLRIGQPDPHLFPIVDWRRCVVSALQAPPETYSDPAGLPELRRVLAHWVGRSRGVETAADQIIVTAGTQHGVFLVARTLLAPGDAVAVEDPGYTPIRRLLHAIGCRVADIPVDDQGLVVDRIPNDVRVVYVTPSHQSPTGATMSLERRRELLAFAERGNVAIIEDDYDSEYRHTDRPLEPLHRLDRHGRVVYLGTFSKTLSPSLRIGFAVLPDALVDTTVAWRELIDWQPPATSQRALHHFISNGMLERHLRKVRRIYRQRHAIVTEHRDRWIEDGLIQPGPENHAGLHLSVRLPPGITEVDVRQKASEHHLALSSYADCAVAPSPEALLIGFGLTSAEHLGPALDLLRESLSPH